MQLSDYITQLQFLLHDQTNADFSQTELINAINNARIVTALDFQCCRTAYLTPPMGANLLLPNNLPVRPGHRQLPDQEIYPLTGAPAVCSTGQIVGCDGYSMAAAIIRPRRQLRLRTRPLAARYGAGRSGYVPTVLSRPSM